MSELPFSSAYRRPSLLPDAAERARLRRRRQRRDKALQALTSAAGIGVVLALAGMFVFLLLQILPLFKTPQIQPLADYHLPLAGRHILYTRLDENSRQLLLLDSQGTLHIADSQTGKPVDSLQLPVSSVQKVTAAAQGWLALAADNGDIWLMQLHSRLADCRGSPCIRPQLYWPLGEAPLLAGLPTVTALALQQQGDDIALAVLADKQLHWFRSQQPRLATTDQPLQLQHSVHAIAGGDTRQLAISADLQHVQRLDANGRLQPVLPHISPSPSRPQNTPAQPAVDVFTTTSAKLLWLAGAQSLIAAGHDGSLVQWFSVMEDGSPHWLPVRHFEPHSAAVVQLLAEHGRRGFISVDASGELALHHATAGRTLLRIALGRETADAQLALSADNQLLSLYQADGRLRLFRIDNPHPGVSWHTLWQKVWYEGRAAPDYVWQSSAAGDSIEPKWSLVPLATGTLKAAVLAMLFAVPLAVMAAIYSAYFMSQQLRGRIKPTLELMEALPTVIIGFLAGIWLAPWLQQHLSLLLTVLLLPLAVLLASLAWYYRPPALRRCLPDGWEAVLLLPVLLLAGAASIYSSGWLEHAVFGGDLGQWLSVRGVDYAQRNALIVGMAMGFALIPGIYSLADDAIFTVPRVISHGSLALGASPWQTLRHVVLPAASPGIFAAIMIGFGRALGETMIVLMASGNSPLNSLNPLEGLRSLAATLAIELPEAAAGSSQYRILFLAVAILFVVTLLANTLAAQVRQRLHRRYQAMAGVA